MKKTELAARIAKESGLSAADALKAARALVQVMAEALKESGQFNLIGFGKLEVVTRKARKGRNPKTGEDLVIPERKAVRWSASRPFLKAAGTVTPRKAPSARPLAAPFTPAETRQPIRPPEAVAAVEPSAPTMPPTAPLTPGALPPRPAPAPAAAGADAMAARAERMARVMVDDMFLYFGEQIRAAAAEGRNALEAVADKIEDARSTLARRVGPEVAGQRDFIGEAFRKKLES